MGGPSEHSKSLCRDVLTLISCQTQINAIYRVFINIPPHYPRKPRSRLTSENTPTAQIWYKSNKNNILKLVFTANFTYLIISPLQHFLRPHPALPPVFTSGGLMFHVNIFWLRQMTGVCLLGAVRFPPPQRGDPRGFLQKIRRATQALSWPRGVLHAQGADWSIATISVGEQQHVR